MEVLLLSMHQRNPVNHSEKDRKLKKINFIHSYNYYNQYLDSNIQYLDSNIFFKVS